MSASEFTTLDRILQRHEDDLIEERCPSCPIGRPPRVDWLEMSHLSFYLLTERYLDSDTA